MDTLPKEAKSKEPCRCNQNAYLFFFLDKSDDSYHNVSAFFSQKITQVWQGADATNGAKQSCDTSKAEESLEK
jgi:hypothetical protein